MRGVVLAALVLLVVHPVACAQADAASAASAASADHGTVPDPRGVQGTVFLAGGGKLDPSLLREFVQVAGGAQARLVVVPTASATADDPAERAALEQLWRERCGTTATVSVLHTRDRPVADSEIFCMPLEAATAVWFGGGSQQRIADAYLGTRFERAVHGVLARGGIVGGTSAGAAIGSRAMIAGGREPPEMATGFDLVPHSVVDQHFQQRNRLPRLRLALGLAPGRFGIGIDEGTAVIASGRRLRVAGSGKALLVLPRSDHHEERTLALAAGDGVDLPTWQRAARNRTLGAWPLPDPQPRVVRNGALVVVGGGALPEPVLARFVALAGGKGARIVHVGSAEADPSDREPALVARMRALGAVEVACLHHRHPSEWTAADSALLARATGVWFGGGRQWRLCDAYDGSPAVAAFHGVLERGGVVGGSSAGATIQGDHLVRGNPLGNTDMWCEGYDRGFGFLRGVAIDQHFLVRRRMGDLTALVERFPQVMGIGIDEGTAAVVTGDQLEVLGDSKVVLLARRPGQPLEPVLLEPGQRVTLPAPTPR